MQLLTGSMADVTGDGWMKKLKMLTGYETALAVECGVSGCEAVLKQDEPAAVKKSLFSWSICAETGKRCQYVFNYVDKGQRLLIIVLLAGLILKTLYSTEVLSFTGNGFGEEADDAFSETAGMTDSIPGYRAYEASFPAVYPEQEIRAGVEACIRYERDSKCSSNDNSAARSLGDSIYTAEGSLVEFCVNVEEEGFYDLSLEYFPLTGSDAAVERSILIDGEVPYKELARVCYDRIWASEGGGCLTERDGWITGVTYDSERRIAEPLSVYLTKGEHTVSLLSIKEPMLLHRILFSQKKQVQEYRQVKGFWDAVGIRAAQGETIVIEAAQADRASGLMEDPAQEDSVMSVIPIKFWADRDEAERGVIDGGSWKKAGAWFEWEFDVEEAGYYHISLCDRQNYVWGADAYRKIMLDGTVPFREMERYGFAYGWRWREDVLADDAGEPYVFYLKEGRHTLRIEAVPGESDPGNSETERVQPLAIDRISIVPAGGAGNGADGEQKAKK